MSTPSFRPSGLPLLLAAIFLPAAWLPAQEIGPKFVFDTGTPPWQGERITLPPSFAPDLGWKGIEEIRFAPGMFDPTSDDFFSYVLVFRLEAGSDISEESLERELLTYYRWLSKAVMQSKNQTVETGGFTLSLEKAPEVSSKSAAATGEVSAYDGVLKWIEPFGTQKDQTLHFEIHTWIHDGHPVVLSCVSPVTPNDAELWKSMRAIRAKFRFE